MNAHNPNGWQPRQPTPMATLLRACADFIDIAINTSGRNCGFVLMLADREDDRLVNCHIVSDLSQVAAIKLTELTLERMQTEVGETELRPAPGDKP